MTKAKNILNNLSRHHFDKIIKKSPKNSTVTVIKSLNPYIDL